MFNLFIKCITEDYFNFHGRANRKEYISFILSYVIISFIYRFVTLYFGYSINLMSLFFILKLFLILPFINLNTRRLHDLGYSGFFQIILITAIISEKYFWYKPAIIIEIIFVLLLSILKSTEKHNKYGKEISKN